MRKIISFMHVSLDGFVAGPNGEMDWIQVDDAIFDYATEATRTADLALYGRTTYQMMDDYWPTAADKPGATRHDKEHSNWYNKVDKIVLSKSMAGQHIPKVTVVSKDLRPQISKVKEMPGGDIVIFGSPGAVQSLMKENLVDQIWLFVNPVLLGSGVPMFRDIDHRKKLTLLADARFPSGVMSLKYEVSH
ncbi:dihydrofolate reductase family protein [Flavitalea sp. BT771]|uniref:dihydrofolate reductase family protein n=1 Tax=Flavitalea sp. BT771 TaxID=3063329 RepID=UPI0026E1D8C1|nr:dihydrofolate reductase family protein [Flavitalea sp. BT771]MDO6431395.1 dihydrofolate reductase family protein [Flavitalea sp. BT771]MDV6220303.1 dihydrofolate reductase family protein [Flavitalea sp. BT771]